MKLVSKMPVLDAGEVAIYNASVDQKDMLELKRDMLRGYPESDVLDFCDVIFYIKCPIFFQLYLSTNLSETNIKVRKNAQLEAWKPDVSYVKAKDLESSEAIASDLAQTTDALLINPLAYQYEGCDHFVSQVITPINVYNDILVKTSLSSWIKFCGKQNLPVPIEQYRFTIMNLLKAEYPHVKDIQVLR